MRQCESKLKLLRTAHELIYRQSYGSVGVDQICEQSGVKKGSFYHFFRSKSELTVAAYQYHWDQVRLRWETIFGATGSPLRKLDAYFAFVVDVQEERLRRYGRLLGCPFVSLGSELSTQDERVRRMAQEIFDQRCAYFARTIREAMEAGEIADAEPEAVACELHSYVMGVVQQAKIANDLGVLRCLPSGAYRILQVQEPMLA